MPDLSMRFVTSELCSVLGLNPLADGTVFTLVLSGNLVDGTPFEAEDCMVTVAVGAGPLLSVASNLPDVWIDVTPMDDAVDGGGFTPFMRSYAGGAPVTLTAPKNYQGAIFLGWSVGDDTGVFTGNEGPLVSGATITVPVTTATSVEAIYGSVNPPTTVGGRRRR